MKIECRTLASKEALCAILKHENIYYEVGIGAGRIQVVYILNEVDYKKTRKVLLEWLNAITDIIKSL